MNKKSLLFSMIFIFSLLICGCKSNGEDDKNTSYDGKTYDISLLNDNSLIAKSTKSSSGYTLEISGTGESKDFADKKAVPWNPIVKFIDKLVINEGISSIGDYLFNGILVTPIILPSSVNSFKTNSFNNSAIVYSFGQKCDVKTDAKVYFYSENRPSENGKFFHIVDNEYVIWDVSKVLFIGNSFTFRQGSEEDPAVPKYFKEVASSLDIPVEIDYVVKSSYQLSSFANPNDEKGAIVEAKLTSNSYNFIILQEQSTTPINSFNTYKSAVNKLVSRINQTQDNAKTVLYQTWASEGGIGSTNYKSLAEMEQGLRNATDSVAKEYNCLVSYVGKAFEKICEEHNELPIYADDKRHQSNLGALLSALVHVETLYHVDVRVSNYEGGFNQNYVSILKEVAHSIVNN